MKRSHLALASVVILLLIVAGAVIGYHWHASHQLKAASQSPIIGKAALGSTAPEFTVATTAGLFDLNKTDKPVFLEVFATWCPHCQRMTTVVDALYAKYGGRVAFVGVSGSDTGMDGVSPENQADVLAWQQRFNVKYPIAYDQLLFVANLYLQGGFPTFAVIDKAKKITYLDSGEIEESVLAAAIEKVL